MFSEDEIKEILVRQRDVILKKDYGIERTLLKEIKEKLLLPHVVVITGLRRSGKSTLLRQIIKKYCNDQNFYYINFEDERLLGFQASEFNRLYEASVSLFGKSRIFFVDEIQNVAHFEIFVRRFYEEGFKFVITGSSAALLSREIGTKLTGRHVDITLKPFSFSEYLALKGVKLTKEFWLKTESRAEIKRHFEVYLSTGGMPEYLVYADQDLLTEVYDDLVIKDIVARYKVEETLTLRQLYLYLISNVSNRFSFNSLRKFTGIKSVNTIKKFIGYIEQTYFATTINKFDYSLKKQIINDKKFYVIDNGFIDALSRTFSKDKGKLLENLVFTNLDTDYELAYYADPKNECDFILTTNRKIVSAVQVCYDLNEVNRDREFNGLLAAMKDFDLKEGLLLTNAQEEEIKANGKKVTVKPVWKWLLEKEEKAESP